MKFGRIAVEGPDGDLARLVMVLPEEARVVDLKRAYSDQLKSEGATQEAAIRVAEAIFPGSMSAAIGAGDAFLQAAKKIDRSRSDRASLAIEKVRWLAASDPSVVRDGLTFV